MSRAQATSPTSHTKSRVPAIWRVVTWLVLLLAIFGVFQYSVHAWRVGAAVAAGAPEAATRALAWDVAYLVVACVTLSAAAGTLLWRGWARPVLRIVAGLLALWLLVTAIMLGVDWVSFSRHSQELMAQPHMGDTVRALRERVRNTYLVAIVLKAVAVPVLAWLAWRLGVPSVRAQFPPLRARQRR
ncbi:MAG TPA: hypothetical protein VFJ15_00195 [Oleiagrimonas sp.]|nr:hypothetical protein [Oleiagrimonas sp.]